jgi:hypothetical protein
VIDHVHVELIYWGAGWAANPTLQAAMTDAVDSILAGPYLGPLAQYRSTIGNGSHTGTITIATTSPPAVFSNSDIVDMLRRNINDQTLPSPANDSQLLYMVITQPGSSAGSRLGEHSDDYSTRGPFRFGWTADNGSLDSLTSVFSEELEEAVTDPIGTAIQVNPRDATNWNEIGDGEAHHYTYRLDNVLVQSYFSQRDHAYIVPTAQAQSFWVSAGGALSVRGDQLANPNDLITIERTAQNGIAIDLNGEVAEFDRYSINSIQVSSGVGTDVVNVKQTVPNVPVTIRGAGTTAVTIGNGGSLGDTEGPVTVASGGGVTTLTVDDSADSIGRAPTLDSVSVDGSAYGRLTGLAPAVIQYQATGTSGVTIKTGSGGATIQVVATPAALTLIGVAASSNSLIGPDAAATWRLTGVDAGILTGAGITGSVAFAGFRNLTGGGDSNTFIFGNGQGVSGVIDDRGARNWLDYSSCTARVTVNLATGQATGVGGGVRNIDDVRGGMGNNVLIGNAVGNILVGGGGNDVLTAGSGRSLLIGGRGADSLVGGLSDDLLIAGSSAFDGDPAALSLLSAEWQRTDRSYAERIADLQNGGGLNGPNRLVWGSTVFDGGDGSVLTGGQGLNWYFAGYRSRIANLKAGEQVNGAATLVFAIGLDDQVYAQKLDARGMPSGAYYLVQTGAVKAICPGRDAHGNPELFVIGLNDEVYAQKFDANGIAVGGYLLTAVGKVKSIVVGYDSFQRPELFVIGLDDQVWAQRFDVDGNSTGPYFLTSVGRVKTVSAGHDAANRPELFVIGLNDQVYAQKFDSNGASAGPYFLTTVGQVKTLAVGSDGGNRPELFVVGLDNQIWVQQFDADGNSAGSYTLMAPGEVKALAVGHDGANRPEVFVIGLNDQVYAQKFDANGNSVGGYLLTAGGSVKSIRVGHGAANDPEVFVTGMDDQVWEQQFDVDGNSASPYFLTGGGNVKAFNVLPL